MPFISDIDGGTPQVFKTFDAGMTVAEAFSEGGGATIYPRGAKARRWTVKWPMLASDAPAFGTSGAAGSRAANEIRARQLEELGGNPNLQPVFIQWFAGGTVTTTAQPQDGWYVIEDVKTNYTNTVFGIIDIEMTVAYVNPGPPRRISMFYSGGTLSTNYAASGLPQVSFPLNTIGIVGGFNLTGAEGQIPGTGAQGINPIPIVLSSYIPDWTKGGVRVYDAMLSVFSNPVGGGNILTNPGFESSAVGALSLPAAAGGWVRNNVGTGTSAIETVNPHTGSNDLILTSPSSGNYGGTWQIQGMPLAGVSQLSVSAWVKQLSGSGTIILRVTFVPASSVPASGISATTQPSSLPGFQNFDFLPSTTGTYAQFNYNVAVPQGAAWVFIELYGSTGSAASFAIDDLIVTPSLFNPNWVEVKGIDHHFIGDAVITNGLITLTIAFANQVCKAYLWNTALATPAWQLFATLIAQDTTFNDLALRAFSFSRIGAEEAAVILTLTGPASGQVYYDTLRLQRGHYDVRFDTRPTSVGIAFVNAHYLSHSVTPKIVYHSSGVIDNAISSGALSPNAVATDYGYCGIFAANTTVPFIDGFLYQNKPNNSQPWTIGNSNVGLGDDLLIAANTSRSYGFYAIPFGSVSGGTTVDKLQAEGETGLPSAGWVSVADATASGGNAAKFPSGTAEPTTTINMQPGWAIPSGTYAVWFRLKVGAQNSATAQVQVGINNATASTFPVVANYAPNSLTTSWAWYKAGTFSTNGTDLWRMFYQATGAASASTDIFLDEAILVPLTFSPPLSIGPQDIWQHFIFDRSIKTVRQ